MSAGATGGKAEGPQSRLAAGWSALERRDLRAGEEIARSVLREDRAQIEFVRLLGASLFMQDRFREAIEPFREVFEKARTAGAGYHLGYCYLEENDSLRAREILEQVVREFPQMAQAHNLLGISLVRESRHNEALAHFTSAIEHAPELAEAHNNLGNALSELGRYEEALSPLEKATQLDAADPQAHNNLGNALYKLRRTEAAVACYRKAIALAPDYVKALGNLAAALVEQDLNDEALACAEKALALDPKYVDAHINKGLAYHALNRFDEAVACHQRALELKPESAEALTNIGLARHGQERLEEAIACHRSAIALRPDLAQAHLNLGFALLELRRYEEAIGPFQKLLAIEPANRYGLGGLLQGELAICSWNDFERVAELRRSIRQGSSVVQPFFLQSVSDDPEEQILCAQGFLADRLPSRRPPLWKGERYGHERIRVAYLSADFREHPVMYCIGELFALHDRSRFEIIGVSFGADDGSAMRASLMKGFDRFLDVRAKDDFQVAKTLRDLEVDIAVDLMGYTRGCRTGILAYRPAPVQVEYLGFVGTTGADFIDYLIVDRFVVPDEERRHYSEQLVTLPDTYIVSHSRRVEAGPRPLRAQAGLPESGFVFCCFNNNYKITPEVFEVWMRLLSKVEGSVLWLTRDNAAAEANLRKEAGRRGVDPCRLVFASFVKRIEEHYARLHLADLFLDTVPYNGHVTTLDALWAGLPVLTCPSRPFAGRVAGSVLHCAGVPELVTRDLGEYEAMALRLAGDEKLLLGLRARIEKNRRATPLFDTERFRRHIESAFSTMRERRERGEEPRAFQVPAIE